jgi:hypothetical protein
MREFGRELSKWMIQGDEVLIKDRRLRDRDRRVNAIKRRDVRGKID